MDPAGLAALAAALEVPFLSRREEHLYSRRRHGRVNAAGAGRARKVDLAGHVLATRIRQHLNPPVHVIAELPGADRTTISHAISLTASLLANAGLQPPAAPPGPRIRTLDDLREYAASHGITIPAAPTAADTPPQDTLATPDTPQTHITLECLHTGGNYPRSCTPGTWRGGSAAGQVVLQPGEEPLGLVQVRAVARILDDHLAVAAAGRGVAVQHGPGLGQHGLRRPGLLAGQPGIAPRELR
jgi:hypothetical protein